MNANAVGENRINDFLYMRDTVEWGVLSAKQLADVGPIPPADQPARARARRQPARHGVLRADARSRRDMTPPRLSRSMFNVQGSKSNLELGTWNLELGTWNLEPETRNPKPETRNPEPGSGQLAGGHHAVVERVLPDPDHDIVEFAKRLSSTAAWVGKHGVRATRVASAAGGIVHLIRAGRRGS